MTKRSAYPRLARVETDEIDELAQRALRAALPPSWYLREMTGKDYGIDYQIEPFEAHMVAPLRTAVQLKGARSARHVEGSPRYAISTRHLASYVDAEVLPVFLVLVDLARDAAYFCFLQEHALTRLKGVPWRDQKTVTIEFDPANVMSDTKRLRAAMRNAHAFMARLRPAAIEAAIQTERDRLESIDRRFAMTITAGADGRRVTLEPRESLSFTLGFQSVSAEQMRAFGAGQPVRFAPGEIVVSGMPLWESINTQGGTLWFAREEACQVTLVVRAAGAERVELANVPARIVRGPDTTRIEVILNDGLLRLTIHFGGHVEREAGSIECGFSCEIGSWVGCDLRLLPFVEKMAAIARLLCRGAVIDSVIHRPGQNIVCPPIHVPVAAGAEGFAEAVVTLSKAHRIARLLDRSIVFRRAFRDRDVMEVEKLYQLVTTGEYRGPGERAEINAVADRARFDRAALAALPADARIQFTGHEHDFPILGDHVIYPLHEVVITKATAVVRAQQRASVRVSFRGVPGAELVLRSRPATAA